MKNDTKTNLKEMIELIQKQELLLPDFQRGFVWDIEMQQRLVASVLTKMPIGSILVLEADTEDFGCRILGRKDEVDTSGGYIWWKQKCKCAIRWTTENDSISECIFEPAIL